MRFRRAITGAEPAARSLRGWLVTLGTFVLWAMRRGLLSTWSAAFVALFLPGATAARADGPAPIPTDKGDLVSLLYSLDPTGHARPQVTCGFWLAALALLALAVAHVTGAISKAQTRGRTASSHPAPGRAAQGIASSSIRRSHP